MIFSQVSVKKVTSPLAINGILDESVWDISNNISINYRSSDNTAKFGILWDDNYLYIGIDIKDKNLCKTGGNSWYSDSVEILIDANNNKSTTIEESDRLFAKPIKSYWIQELKNKYEGVIHQWIKTSDGYSMEFAISWSNFNISPTAGTNLGLNIAVNDDDNPVPNNNLSRLTWKGNTDYYSNPSKWGTISLSNTTVSFSNKFISLITPNGGDFCINNRSTKIEWISNGISKIDIDYSTDNGSSWKTIISNYSASTGSYLWNISSTPSNQCLVKISDSENKSTSNISKAEFTIYKTLGKVEPLLRDSWDNFVWPYNAYYPEDENGVNRHSGSPCGPASLARIIHYWEYPIVGFGQTSTDYYGKIYSANFGATTYNYDNMPNFLPTTSTEEEYRDAAILFYHTATAIFSEGANIEGASEAMKTYFNYKNTILYRDNFSRAEWMKLIIDDLDKGRVLLITGLTPEIVSGWNEGGAAGHFYHVDGYNEEGKFHVVVGYGNEDGYYDANHLIDFSTNLTILSGLEPNLNGKEIKLTNFNDNEFFPQGQILDINWQSSNIDKIRIEYTSDNGKNWNIINDNVSASIGTYSWTPPNISSSNYKIKITDITDINVYDKSNNAFAIKSPEIILLSPNGGEKIMEGETFTIRWSSVLVENIKIEYSSNNGADWEEIISSTPANSQSFVWNAPATTSDNCKIRISDSSNSSLYSISEKSFSLGYKYNSKGGPYLVDNNTLVLLHFENSLTNSSSICDDGVLHGKEISYSNSVSSSLGKSLRLKDQSFISIPHHEALNLTDDWTIELWFYLNSLEGDYTNPTFVSKSDRDGYNYFLWYHNNWGSVKGQYKYSGGDVYSTAAFKKITTGKWYHLKYTRDNSTYINKIVVRDENLNVIESKEYMYGEAKSVPITNNNDLLIGKLFGTNNFFIDGYIDEVRVSNIVREWDIPLQGNFYANKITGTKPLEVNFTDLSTSKTSTVKQWSWDFDGDGNIDSHEQNPTWTYNNLGKYTVSLTVSNGTDTETYIREDYINVTEHELAIDDNDIESLYSIYPNPANNKVYIDIPSEVNLRISTIAGKTIIKRNHFKGGSINTSNLSDGMYLVIFESTDGTVIKKLIIK